VNRTLDILLRTV